jgi:sulfite exporter TauE/SafE/copper chaperone CopZ
MGLFEITIRAHGMHCHGCERIIEHAIEKLAGVRAVKADYPTETVRIELDANAPALSSDDDIRDVVERAGYRVFALDDPVRRSGLALRIAGAIAAAAAIGAIVLFDTAWISRGGAPDVTQHLSLGLIFALGLLTGFHCVGMCGPFVLSYAADDAEAGRSSYLSHLLYGAGKTLSYTAIGAAFGQLGAFVAFTPLLRGAVGLLAGVFLVGFGLNMLGFLTPLRRFRLGLPAPLQDFISSQAGRRHRPFVIGLLNGLMIACGPLQAMYVSAAGTGSAVEGAKMLFAFGVGTLPALTAFGMLATVISGAMTHRLLKLSGVLVVLLGAVMFNRGLILTGSGYDLGSILAGFRGAPAPQTEPAPVPSEKPQPAFQTVDMEANAFGFAPTSFIVMKAVPVKWIIAGKEITTCNNRIVVPKLDLDFAVALGRQTIEFTPQETGVIPWSCWMGMLHGHFEVVDVLPTPGQHAHAVVATLVYAAEEPPPARTPERVAQPRRTYVVAPGDTLARIAAKQLGDARRWRDIVAANPGLDPRRLRPGQTIGLPAP